MPVVLKGFAQTEARIAALAKPQTQQALMQKFGVAMVGELKRNVVRKTGSTGRSIQLRGVSAHKAEVWGSKVAVWLDTGTGLFGPYHARIVPRSAQFLRWKTGPNRRLSGKPRKGTPQNVMYARSVAGMKPRPFIKRSLDEAIRKIGLPLVGEITKRWNDAA